MLHVNQVFAPNSTWLNNGLRTLKVKNVERAMAPHQGMLCECDQSLRHSQKNIAFRPSRPRGQMGSVLYPAVSEHRSPLAQLT